MRKPTFFILALFLSSGLEAAISRYGYRVISSGTPTARQPQFIIADTFAECPSTDVGDGDICYGKDTNLMYARESGAWVEASNVPVANTKLANMAANTVKANPTAGATTPSDLAVGANSVVGRAAAGDIVAAQVATGQIANDAVDNTKAANMAANTVKANATAGATDPADLSVGTNSVVGRVAGNIVAAQVATGQVADDAITYAKIQNVSATQRALGRNTGGAGDTEEVTATQLLDWIGATRGSILYRGAAGWAILSPGTATHVLTSNGAGADPSYQPGGGGGGGSPGGSDTQVQYNNAGAFGGSSGLTWNDSTQTLGLAGANAEVDVTGVTNEPSAPSTGILRVYSRSVAGRMLPKWIGPSGVDTSFQPAIFQNRVICYLPSSGTTGTGSGTCLGPAWTSNGTVSHPTPSTTAPAIANQTKRTRYANVVTTTNQQLGPRFAAASEQQFWVGNAAGLGGFFFQARFIVELYPASTVRLFAGLSSTATGSVVISDTVLNNTVGLWHDTTDPSSGANSFNFVTRNTTTTTKTSIALSNAIAAGNLYDFYMFCPPNGSTISYRLTDVNNGVEYSGSTSTTLPVNTAFMQPQVQMSNGTANVTVTTVAIGIGGIYVESDR